jgi:hypothetical protein
MTTGALTYCHEKQLKLASFNSHVTSHDLYNGQVNDPVLPPNLDSFGNRNEIESMITTGWQLLDHDQLVDAGLLEINFDGLGSCRSWIC